MFELLTIAIFTWLLVPIVMIAIAAGILKACVRYVCCKCGYSEEWIDKEDIQKLKERF